MLLRLLPTQWAGVTTNIMQDGYQMCLNNYGGGGFFSTYRIQFRINRTGPVPKLTKQFMG